MSETIVQTAEEGLECLDRLAPTGDAFTLLISNSMTFAGREDHIGAGMAVIGDKILGMGYLPDGFEQKEGFRLYRYKKM